MSDHRKTRQEHHIHTDTQKEGSKVGAHAYKLARDAHEAAGLTSGGAMRDYAWARIAAIMRAHFRAPPPEVVKSRLLLSSLHRPSTNCQC